MESAADDAWHRVAEVLERRPVSDALLRASFLVPFVVLAACAAPPGGEPVGESEDELRTSYGDLFETLTPADVDRWALVRSKLREGFDRICGDTICGGDFSNLATVRITCSSTRVARKMRDCAWVLGGNIDYVDAGTGKLTGEARAFTCRIPVASSAKQFLDTLSAAGDDALNAPLPGTGASFYDGLVACFEGVASAPPPASNGQDFAELGDFLWEQGAAGSAWSQTKQSLAEAFESACGDTFCEGDFPAIAPLRLACAVKRSTGYVPRCVWTFAAADTSVDSRGRVRARTTTKRCAVAIDATASALTAALSGPDPLHAALPGRTTSIHDALASCL